MFTSQARAFISTQTHSALGCLRQQQSAALARTFTSASRTTYGAVQRQSSPSLKDGKQRRVMGVNVGSERGLNASVWRRGSLRGLHSTSVNFHSGIERPAPGTGLKVHFKDSNGDLIKTVEANEGDDILAIAHEYDIDLEGACEGSVACSTCHVILPESYYDLLPEPEDDENDMLDMAFGLTDTSRLGCQIFMKKELDGIECRLPAATRNMFVDGKKSSH